MKKLLLTLAISFFAAGTLASPDHDHGAASFKPRRKGIIESTHHNHFEMAREGNKILLYAYDKEGADLTTDKLKISTKLEIPKKGNKPVEMKDMKSYWETEVDFQGAHRVTFTVNVGEGKDKDYVKFTFEK